MAQNGITQDDLHNAYKAPEETPNEGEGNGDDPPGTRPTAKTDALKTVSKADAWNNPSRPRSTKETIALFKQLNALYGGFLAKFDPKRFKYSGGVNAVVNIVDIINSQNMGEVGEKVSNILIDKGLEYISLGELKTVYDGLDFIYNQTEQGNLEMSYLYGHEIALIESEHHDDIGQGGSWRKQLETYQKAYDGAKDRYFEAYYEENGFYPEGNWYK